jgi:hypothetical protein
MSMIMKGIQLGGCFFPGLASAAFRHYCVVEAVSKAFREHIKLIIAVNLDGFLGGIHHYVAFVAPMEMLIQFHFKVIADLAVKIVGQLF